LSPRTEQVRRRLLSLGVVAAIAAATGYPAGPAAAEDDTPTLPSLQVVVLVDESGSLSDTDVVKEKEAARTIAFSVLAPQSQVSVVGFGSADASGQSAVDVVCKPTVLDGQQSRDSLGKCVDALHRRARNEGNDTDHAAALQQALSIARAGGPEHKIVFLLTDGKLDVSNSPAYGDTPQRRNTAAAGAVRQTLAALAKVKAQVWPLGFGAADRSALAGFAEGQSCTEAAADPQARVVSNSAQLTAAVADAFSSASCVKYDKPVVDHLPGQGSVDLHLDMPAIASDASILVYKHDPRVQVEYTAPGAAQPAPGAGGSRFELAGQNTSTESLKITDPVPGRWTIHLSSADAAASDVAANVVYQAAVKAAVTVNPPQPSAGQNVEVDMQVWARGKAITDPQALQGLSFVATLTGAGIATPLPVKLSDPDGDGTYTGQLTVPSTASGALNFSGQVTGVGIGGDTRVYPTRVQSAAAAVQGQILFDVNRAGVHPGDTVPGTVSVTNDSGQPAGLRLVVADPSAGSTLTFDPATITAGPGRSTTKFNLRIDTQQPGVASATLRLVLDRDPSVVAAERLFAADVTPPPTWPRKYWWIWVPALVLLLAAVTFVVLRWRRRVAAAQVRGLVARLMSEGAVASELLPREPRSKVFRFAVHDEFSGPQLQYGVPGEANLYEVRRLKDGLELTGPHGTKRVQPGVPHPVRERVTLVMQDDRGAGGGADSPVEQIGYDAFGGLAATGGGAVPGTGADPGRSAVDYGDPFAAGGGSYNADPFETGGAAAAAPAADPFGTAAAAPPPGRAAGTDPFGDGASGSGDPFAGDPYSTYDPFHS
jgi:hypothetical protein